MAEPEDSTGAAMESWSGAARCRISVQDNGIGVDEELIDRVFSLFQRLHNRSEYEGAGTGLAICRKMTERHGVTITAQRRSGEGTTFIVRFAVKGAVRLIGSCPIPPSATLIHGVVGTKHGSLLIDVAPVFLFEVISFLPSR